MQRILMCMLCSAFTLVGTPMAQAAFIVSISEIGANVVATGTGTLNTTAFTTVLPGIQASSPEISANNAILDIGNTSPIILDVYLAIGVTISGPNNFGTGGISLANAGSGNRVAINGPIAISLDPGYVSGSSLSSTSTWFNQSFATLGITPGTYTWSWGENATADSFTVNVITAVPEPSTTLLIAVACAGLCYRKKHKRGW